VIVSSLDGLLMSGGADINPLLIGEEPIPQLQDVDPFRDEYDFILLRLAINRQLPIMAICRGHQILNVAFGGTIYQDIYSQSDGKHLKHSQSMAKEFASHTVKLTSDSVYLKDLFNGVDTLRVNSFHHQAVHCVAPGFINVAESPDGINEAIEHKERAIFGVQWHPEAMATNGDEMM
ncbi:glutamine amidotransferase, class II/dipeptidase, partial [gut metagenome]